MGNFCTNCVIPCTAGSAGRQTAPTTADVIDVDVIDDVDMICTTEADDFIAVTDVDGDDDGDSQLFTYGRYAHDQAGLRHLVEN